jgi:hypothetical protein
LFPRNAFGKDPKEFLRPVIIRLRIHGYPQGGVLPFYRGQGTVEKEQIRMGIEIGTDMFPFGVDTSLPFRPEQGFRGYGLHPGSVGKPLVTGIISPQPLPFPADGLRSVDEHEGVISGCPNHPVRFEAADGNTVTPEHILSGSRNQLKARLLRQGTKGGDAVLRTGKDVKAGADPLQGFHDAEDQGPPPQGEQGFPRQTA